MATYTQSERPLEVTTPLGKDALLLTRFRGSEAISELFCFELDLLATVGKPIEFEKILGQAVTVRLTLTNDDKRYFNGIVNRFSQAGRSDRGFGKFRATVVPHLWMLTRTVRSRTFQHLSVPEMLRLVLVGIEVNYCLIGSYPPRDYCVQYQESDFAFASRLMEEEGIFYFFDHKIDVHTMVVSDRLHLPVESQRTITYDEDEGSVATEMRIRQWEKTQNLGSGEFTLWDHCFEMPGNNLEAKKKITEQVVVGTVTHKLRVPGNEKWEIYEYPGEYARRFDGMDTAGNPDPQGIQNIFEDRTRAVAIRMQRDETAALDIRGEGYCGNFSAGHTFALKRHFDADGEYLLTRVEHEAVLEDYQTGGVAAFRYANRFQCVPVSMNFRPLVVTPKPRIDGVQTALVVGPPGEEIFVDKYGRVKVQFYWDREGKKDAGSSCWIRVSQVWAGKGWGAFFWPRIGNEVVVAFEEGDPDQPIVVGSVYNAENMPWFKLPNCKDFAGLKSASMRGNAHQHYNGMVMVDRKGQEHMAFHSERDMVFNAEFDKMFQAGRHHGERVPLGRTISVGSLPGSGSGGGGPNKNLYPTPEPQAVLGLNSTVVNGSNFQVAMPLNFQMAFGSNVQVCINPSSFQNLMGDHAAGPAPPAVAQVMGSGGGGNMQLTLGSSANFVIGQSYDINIGPRRITVDVHDTNTVNMGTKVVGWIIIGLAALFVILYDCIQDDDGRAACVIIYELAMQVLLAFLMSYQTLSNVADGTLKGQYLGFFDADSGTNCMEADKAISDPTKYAHFPVGSDGDGIGAVCAVMILPLQLEIAGEVRLDTSA